MIVSSRSSPSAEFNAFAEQNKLRERSMAMPETFETTIGEIADELARRGITDPDRRVTIIIEWAEGFAEQPAQVQVIVRPVGWMPPATPP